MKLKTYRNGELETVVVHPEMPLRVVMARMNEAGLRLVPVVEHDSTLVGIVADGDIRRYIANGGALDDPIQLATNRNPKVLDSPLASPDLRNWLLAHKIETAPETSDGKLIALHVLWVVDNSEDMTAVIMAGGLGSRLSPLTDHCPKPLLKVGDRPILTHIIEHLRGQGVRRFVLPVNYLSGMIKDHYGDGSDLDVEISYVEETNRMGTGGALSLIDPALLSDPFIVMNGDLLNDVDLGALAEQHKSMGWHGTMVVRKHHYTIPYGVVHAGDDQSFLNAEEKPTFSYLINAGIYLLSRDALPLVPAGAFYDLPTMFADMTARGMRSGVFAHDGRWLDIGNKADFERAQSIFESKKP